MKKKILSVALCALLSISSLAPAFPVLAADAPPATIPAFPGAEGGGMYTSGGRGCDVYEVTNLNDSGPGSLRDAISADNRMVVFRVSGTIKLTSTLKFANRKNITVAGQTAPGDGICIAGYGTDLSTATNIIIRYLRFRPGSAYISSEPDSIGATGANYLMVDHVSAGWSTDESMSFYGNSNTTIQWSIISESLTLSGHFKGKHGYGGIWGGDATTFHHNLLATHTSRMSRIGNGTSPGTMTQANNVIYNWGFNNTYGGLDSFNANILNNYYKPGPATLDTVKERLINPNAGAWYIKGNYMVGSPSITADNRRGIQVEDPKSTHTISSTVFNTTGYSLLTQQNNSTDHNKGVGLQDPQVAYGEVLSKAGATLPRRDAVDARVVQDVKDGTGRMVNREYEVGGYPALAYTEAEVPTDTDHDGMPDTWEDGHGLNKSDKEDGKAITASGYSNLEVYLNTLADMGYIPENPVVKVTTPTYNGLYAEGGKMKIDVDAADADGIDRVEFYKDDVKVGEDLEAPYSFTLENVVTGTYFISARAYDKKGNATQSTSMPVFVNGAEVGAPWTSVDIGNTPVKGSGSLDTSGTLTVKGSGKITGTADSFHYVYKPISGNASLTARLDSIALVDNNTISGLMIRDGLDVDSAEAIISTSIVKADKDENGNGDSDDTYYATYFSSRMSKGEAAQTLDEDSYPQEREPEKANLPALVDCKLPIWLKIERADNTIVAFTSYDGTTWKELARKTFTMGKDVYIGFAVDAAQHSNGSIYYSTAKFSNIKLENSFTVTDVKLTDVLGNEVTSLTSGLSAVAAVTVQKNSLAIEDAVIAIQICDADDNVLATSYVKSEFNIGQTKTVKAGFSTPIGLDGLKIKSFVINSIKDGVKISNEVSVQ